MSKIRKLIRKYKLQENNEMRLKNEIMKKGELKIIIKWKPN